MRTAKPNSKVKAKTRAKTRTKKKTRKSIGIIKHLKSLGFSNRLAIYIIVFLAAGLMGGFYLAMRCISTAYTGALMCWSIVFTPIGTACSIVLSRIVDKSRAENTSGKGDGIKYALMLRQNEMQQEVEDDSWESPRI